MQVKKEGLIKKVALKSFKSFTRARLFPGRGFLSIEKGESIVKRFPVREFPVINLE